MGRKRQEEGEGEKGEEGKGDEGKEQEENYSNNSDRRR